MQKQSKLICWPNFHLSWEIITSKARLGIGVEPTPVHCSGTCYAKYKLNIYFKFCVTLYHCTGVGSTPIPSPAIDVIISHERWKLSQQMSFDCFRILFNSVSVLEMLSPSFRFSLDHPTSDLWCHSTALSLDLRVSTGFQIMIKWQEYCDHLASPVTEDKV